MKKIPLSRGKFAIVDDEDYDELVKHKWYALKSSQTFYAARNVRLQNGRRTAILMHRQILKAQLGQQVDHRNHKGLDNRRTNIRLCTHAQNCFNMRDRPGTSRYKGVCWKKQNHKWVATIQYKKRRIHLGYFEHEYKAAQAYAAAAKKYFGEFALVASA